MGEVATYSLCAALLVLTGVDLKISAMRWKSGIRDLNPIVEHFRKGSVLAGQLALCAINLLVLAAATLYQPLLWMLLGGKLALASLQIRSLIENG